MSVQTKRLELHEAAPGASSREAWEVIMILTQLFSGQSHQLRDICWFWENAEKETRKRQHRSY